MHPARHAVRRCRAAAQVSSPTWQWYARRPLSLTTYSRQKMQPSQNAINLAKASEGLRLEAYPDPATGGAPWTIGYGRAHGVNPGDTCTQEQAEAWLVEDLNAAADIVRAAVKVPLTQGQFDALTDFVFNVGPGAKGVKDGFVSLRDGSPSTMLWLINAGQLQGAACQFKYWVMAAGKPMPGLVKRRAAERALFETPA